MAAFTVCRKLCRSVVRVAGLVIITGVATKTGVGGIGVISIMAGRTVIGNGSMCTYDRIKTVMVK